MKKVGTAILKNHLSSYLKEVQKGINIIITDRGIPIAKLVPIDENSENNQSIEEKLLYLSHIGYIDYNPSLANQGNTKKQKLIKLKGEDTASTLAIKLRREGAW